jgi:hypothetical protein
MGTKLLKDKTLIIPTSSEHLVKWVKTLGITVAVILAISLFLLERPSSSSRGLVLTHVDDFSVIGSYSSDSLYSMAEIYSHSSHTSLFLSPFLWNVQSAQGYVNLTYSNSTLITVINLTNVAKVSPQIDVDGYPGLMYGQELWFPFSGRTVMDKPLLFPANITSLPQLYSTLDYRVWVRNGSVVDFSYDIWLTQDPNVTQLQFPDVELMIWLFHQGNLNGTPYFIYEGEVNVTVKVNGTPMEDTFSVYVLPHTGNANGWIGVYYLSSRQLEGKVEIPLTFFVKDEFRVIGKVFSSLSPPQYYLDAVQVGMEFNDAWNPLTGVDSALMGYTLYSWSVQTSG